MKAVITKKNELDTAVKSFQNKMAAFSTSSKTREWVFPNGKKELCKTYSVPTDLGELLVAIPQKWSGRQAHLFSLGHEGGVLAPDVEINIPDELNRKVSGTYIETDGEIWICTRGAFTAYRGKIPKEVSLRHFEKWLVTVEDGKKTASLITIASLNSPSLSNDIAEFVSAVSELKQQFKTENLSPKSNEKPKVQWRDSEEYEGEKSHSSSGRSKNYEYLHGPLCNALSRQLKKHVKEQSSYEVLSNANIDVAIVNTLTQKAIAIFEVKTTASLSNQLYSAHGQLSYYKFKYGDQSSSLYLVLPKVTQTEMNCLEFFKNSGIEVLFGEKENFQSTNGNSLLSVVNKCVGA